MGSAALTSSDQVVESATHVNGGPVNESGADELVVSRGSTDQVHVLKQELKQLKSTVTEMKKKLEESRLEKIRINTELESLRKFVNVTDKSHGSEVSSIVKSINDDVYQLASDLVQGWPLRQPRGETLPPDEKRQELSEFVSPTLIGTLSKCPPMHPRASMLLQYAIQGYLQTCINWFMHNISSVLLGKQFEGIDRRIRKSESQVTYGRWRALTYYYAQEGIKSGQEEFSKVVLDDAPSDIIALGQFMTEHPPNKDHVKEVTEDTISAFTRILENVHRLAIVMRQNIISSNFRLYLPSPDDTFHSRKHDLPAPLPKVEGRDRIIVTLRIGTQKEEKVGRDGIEGAKTEYHIHDRPQVVTVRLLQELLSQNTGSPTRRRQTTRPTKDEITMAVTPKGG